MSAVSAFDAHRSAGGSRSTVALQGVAGVVVLAGGLLR